MLAVLLFFGITSASENFRAVHCNWLIRSWFSSLNAETPYVLGAVYTSLCPQQMVCFCDPCVRISS